MMRVTDGLITTHSESWLEKTPQKVTIFLFCLEKEKKQQTFYILTSGQHGGAVVSAAASQREGRGFGPWPRAFLCGVCMLSLSVCRPAMN